MTFNLPDDTYDWQIDAWIMEDEPPYDKEQAECPSCHDVTEPLLTNSTMWWCDMCAGFFPAEDWIPRNSQTR